MKRLVYSSEAVENLKKIYDHTKKNFSRDKAKNVIDELFGKIAMLQKFPHAGKISPLSDLVRELIVEGNVVFYQITDETVDIIFIKPRKSLKK